MDTYLILAFVIHAYKSLKLYAGFIRDWWVTDEYNQPNKLRMIYVIVGKE